MGAVNSFHRGRGGGGVFVFVQRLHESHGRGVVFYLVWDHGWVFYHVLVARVSSIGRPVEGEHRGSRIGSAESGGGESVDDWVDGEFGWVRRYNCWFASDNGVIVREDADDCGDGAVRAKRQPGVGAGYFLGSSGEQRHVGALVGDEHIAVAVENGEFAESARAKRREVMSIYMRRKVSDSISTRR